MGRGRLAMCPHLFPLGGVLRLIATAVPPLGRGGGGAECVCEPSVISAAAGVSAPAPGMVPSPSRPLPGCLGGCCRPGCRVSRGNQGRQSCPPSVGVFGTEKLNAQLY